MVVGEGQSWGARLDAGFSIVGPFVKIIGAGASDEAGCACMPSSFSNDPLHWRDRADDIRTLASETTDPESRAIMLRLATNYEALARRVEQLAGTPPHQPPTSGKT